MAKRVKVEYFTAGFGQWFKSKSFSESVQWAKDLLRTDPREDLVCVYETYTRNGELIKLPLADVTRWKGEFHVEPQCLGDMPQD